MWEKEDCQWILVTRKKVDSISVMIRDGCDEEMKYTYTYEGRCREVYEFDREMEGEGVVRK